MHGGSDGQRQGQDGLSRAPAYALARGPGQPGGGRGGAGITGAAGSLGHRGAAALNPQAGSLTQPPPSSSSLGRPPTQHSQTPSPHHWAGGPGHGRYLEPDQDMRASADVWGSIGSGARGAGARASNSNAGYTKPPSRVGGGRPMPLASPRSHKDSQAGYSQGSQGRSYVCPSPVEGGSLSTHPGPGYLRAGTAAGLARSGGGGVPPPGSSLQPTMTWPGQQGGGAQIPVVSDGDVAAFFKAAEASHMLPQDSSSDPLLGGGSQRLGPSIRAAILGGPAWTMGASVFEHDGRPGTRGGGTMYDLDGRPLTRNGRPPSRMQVSTMRSSHDTGGGGTAHVGTGGMTYASVTSSGLSHQQQQQHYPAPQHQQPALYHSPSGRRTAPAPAPGQGLRGGQAMAGAKDAPPPAGALARIGNGPRLLQPLQHRGLGAAGGALTHAPPLNPLQSRSSQSKSAAGQTVSQKAGPRSGVAVGVHTVAEEADVDAILEGVGDVDLSESGNMDDLNNYLAAIDQDKRASAQKSSVTTEVSSLPKQQQDPAPEPHKGPSQKAMKAAHKIVDQLMEQAVRCSEVNALIRAAEEKALAEETELQVVLAEHGWEDRVRATVASPVGDEFSALKSQVLPTGIRSGQAPLSADSDDVLAVLPSPDNDFKGLSSSRAQVPAFGTPVVSGLVSPPAKMSTVSPMAMPLGMARYAAHRVQS